MKLIILAVAATLQWKLATSLAVERRDDPHDRGTWHLNCDKAGGACNNACWSIICLQQDTRKMYYDPGNNNEDNRIASGCDAGGSVCNTMPFSQKLNDPQKLTKPSCDEWPMAETKQDQKSNPNVLRCIDQSENSSGGAQLRNFIKGQGDQKDRKGKGDFVAGDYWQVDFQNLDQQKSPFCFAKPGQCTNDGYQFYLSKNINNKIDKEYDYDNNNHYALSGPGDHANIDIAQCRVHLHRSSQKSNGKGSDTYIQYDAEVFDYKGKSKGKGSANSPTEGNPLSVEGVTIWAGKSADSLDDKPNYKVDNIQWENDGTGKGGPYCNVGPVDSGKGTRDEDCRYPCFIS